MSKFYLEYLMKDCGLSLLVSLYRVSRVDAFDKQRDFLLKKELK